MTLYQCALNLISFLEQLLLSLAKSLFEEQMSLERLVSTIITEAKSLLTCERCTVYLLDLRMYDAVRFFLKCIQLEAQLQCICSTYTAPKTNKQRVCRKQALCLSRSLLY